MIRISAAPEPADFETSVRVPGQTFLAGNPVLVTSKDWKGHDHWKVAIPWLREAYGSICAYFCHWIPFDVGTPTVDHFVDKHTRHDLAYEWLNFRLASGRANGRKGIKRVIDPFTMGEGWFRLQFPSLKVKPNRDLSPQTQAEIENTIDILGLNDEPTCVQQRLDWLLQYIECDDKQFLKRNAPFIYSELERQDLLDDIKSFMAMD